MTSALACLVGFLTEQNPTQALRVAVALVLQRDSAWASAASAGEALQIWRGIARGPLRDACASIFADLDPEDFLHHGTARAWNKSLLDAWRAVFAAPPPCNGPWRALRLAVALEEGPGVSRLSSDLAIPYANLYGRAGRIDLRHWRGVLEELGSRARGPGPVVVPSVVPHGQDSARYHQNRESRTATKGEARKDHRGTQEPNVSDPDGVAFQLQHPPPQPHGFVLRELNPGDTSAMVLVPVPVGTPGRFTIDGLPPTARLTISRRSAPST